MIQVEQPGAAHDEDFDTGFVHILEGPFVAGAVDLDQVAVAVLILEPLRLPDFMEHFGDEGLACEAGVHGHDGDFIDFMNVLFDVVQGSGWIEYHAELAAQGLDLVDDAESLRVDGLRLGTDVGGASLGQGFDIIRRIRDHQMTVDFQIRGRADALDEIRGQGDVLDEMAVHDIYVEQIGPTIEHIQGFLDPENVHAHEGR